MKELRYIHTGEYHSSSSPIIIGTTLGSCIAVCLHDKKNSMGGMNHILLPGMGDSEDEKDTRYGTYAMELLINDLIKIGANRFSLEAKIFGGASMIENISRKFPTGQQNIEFIMKYLEDERIPINSYCLGGKSARRIYFHTDSGKVFVRIYNPTLQNDPSSRNIVKNKRIDEQLKVKKRVILFEDED